MVVFCQNSRLIERYQNEIARAPDRAVNYFRRRAGGRGDRPRPAGPRHVSASRPEGAARRDDRRHIARWERPATIASGCSCGWRSQARKSKRWDEASAHLDQAAAVARSDPERLQAQLLRADVLLDAGRPKEAVEICERLLTDEPLASAGRCRRRRPSHDPCRSLISPIA